jgi:hypothetical protein
MRKVRFHRITRLCAALAALLPLATFAATGDRSGPDAVLVDVTRATRSQLDALQQADGVDWWVEAGEVLLLAGDGAALQRTGDAEPVVRTIDTLRADELYLHARGCGVPQTAVPDELVLLRGSSYDLVRRPRAFSPLADINLDSGRPAVAGAEWRAVERNSVIARLHRFDRPHGPARPDARISEIVERVDGTRWFANVSTLADWDRSSFSAELTPARQWIASQFAALDLEVSEPFFTFNYSGNVVNVANVVGRFEGVLHPDEWIVVGAHYDSRQQDIMNPNNSPGADDNASGCAGVIEAANAIVDSLPQRTVIFMCYAGEEQWLYGSQDHVSDLAAAGDLPKVKAMLNMDMIGWSANATLGVIVGTDGSGASGPANLALAQLLADAALTYAPAFSEDHIVIDQNSCCSDHMPYLDAGRPATMSIHRGSAGAYPHYHRTTDTPANLGPHAQDIGAATVRMNVAALAQLAGTDRIFRARHETD